MGCKSKKNNVKVLLNNIFPAGVCDMICDYNTHCFKCNNLIFKENEYIKEENPPERVSTVEKQIHFFQTEMPVPIFLSNTNRTDVRQMRREIDTLMGTPAMKERFKHDKVFLQAIVSYVKKFWKNTYHILKYTHDLDMMTYMKKIRIWWFPTLEAPYVFRNRTFIIKDILEVFLREYLKDLFSGYEQNINQTEIEEHLQKIINT